MLNKLRSNEKKSKLFQTTSNKLKYCLHQNSRMQMRAYFFSVGASLKICSSCIWPFWFIWVYASWEHHANSEIMRKYFDGHHYICMECSSADCGRVLVVIVVNVMVVAVMQVIVAPKAVVEPTLSLPCCPPPTSSPVSHIFTFSPVSASSTPFPRFHVRPAYNLTLAE